MDLYLTTKSELVSCIYSIVSVMASKLLTYLCQKFFFLKIFLLVPMGWEFISVTLDRKVNDDSMDFTCRAQELNKWMIQTNETRICS